jgi:16S rRNA (uracil1498-N3)-methyltransferase
LHPTQARQEKLERYVIEASKQCGRNVLLQVDPVIEWAEYCRGADRPEHRIVAHGGPADAEPGTIAVLASQSPPGERMAVAVGPEGGFTDEEVAVARASGWSEVTLGPRVLRVETAAVVLAAWACGTVPPIPSRGAL